MSKMMMGQIDHARKRVRDIKAGLLGKAPEPEKVYHINDLTVGLRDGTVTFTGAELKAFAQEWAEESLSSTSRYNKVSFESIVLAKAFAKERAAEKKRYDLEKAAYDSIRDRVAEKATAVEDAIVLGDQHAALAALQDFAAFKV